MHKLIRTVLFLAAFATNATVLAETIAYTYDAKGRHIKVEHSGGANSGIKTEYTHDKADNRVKVKTTGAP